MEEAPVTAATGALGPVITKLAALLGSEYKLRWRTRRDVKFIRSKLKPMHSILWNVWEREELDEASMALKMEALDLADDVDDAIIDFILSMERSRSTKRFVQTKIKASPFQNFKKRASDVSGRCRGKWKEKKKPALDDASRHGKSRAYPFVHKDASELVGMDGTRDDLIQHLIGKDETSPVEQQVKTAIIYGVAGMGKTTLADQVYEAIGNKFQTRTFVSLTPGGNMKEVLARILQQVAANTSVPVAGTQAVTEEENLIESISNLLKNKRYLVIIDDIWNWREWEVIMKSIPTNNLGSRIVGTTRIKAVADRWYKDSHGPNALLQKMLPNWDREKGWFYQIGINNIASGMVAMKVDLVAEGLDDDHFIVQMCGGTPLAVLCMLSAVAAEREKLGQQGLHAKTCAVQDEIEKHVKENGIHNTPGFEPLVESLQLGYDDLPHHMLKTCLLYCSIYPHDYHFEKDVLVRQWISEGFVCKEEEAHGYFEELVNRGFIMRGFCHLRMQPMMRNFLRWKSCKDNFTTCSSELTLSYENTCRVRRLCIYNSPCRSRDEVDPLSTLDWYHIRSLIVLEGIERVPFEKLEGVRVLDLCQIKSLHDHHLKDICDLVRLRHLLGLNGGTISEIPPEIVRLQCLETFEGSAQGLVGLSRQTLDLKGYAITELPREIGALQQLKTLEVQGYPIKELPREIGYLQQLHTLRITNTNMKEVPREIGALQKLETLDMSYSYIRELPMEIGNLQQLKSLDMSHTRIKVLPREIGSMHQLKTLDISNTLIKLLPKEIGKLRHLENILMSGTLVEKIPREIARLKELKIFKLDYSLAALPLEVCHASTFVELPECIQQAFKKSDLLSELAREMVSVQISGGLVVGAKQLFIPPWIGEHFNDLQVLDIRICALEEQGLKILREMPQLEKLTLRFEVVPRDPVVISSEGFAMLTDLTIDSRVPRVTYQKGAMPRLKHLKFQFQFYAGPTNKDPVGINHLRNLTYIEFKCNKDWYGGGDSPCIRPTIDVLKKEALKLPYKVNLFVCGSKEVIYTL
uniref:Uncharacterized protein n=1 Tax=Avena sativa TaxID=4498 RepID=A0ACD5X471_AVESA